jgi:hypothetical protein
MKVGLNVPKNIGGKVFPAGCVVDLFDREALALIESGEGSAVADGTMARKKAYGVPGCMAPAGFDNAIKVDNTSKSGLRDAIRELEKQKTNTLKK